MSFFREWIKPKPLWLQGLLYGFLYPAIVLLLGKFVDFILFPARWILMLITHLLRVFYGPGFFVPDSFIITQCGVLSSSFTFCFLLVHVLAAVIIGLLVGSLIGLSIQKFSKPLQ